MSSKLKNKQIQDLSDQFNAAIIGYDEGILSDDKVLAGALWRRFFNLDGNNPEHIEKLIIYVRKQVSVKLLTLYCQLNQGISFSHFLTAVSYKNVSIISHIFFRFVYLTTYHLMKF